MKRLTLAKKLKRLSIKRFIASLHYFCCPALKNTHNPLSQGGGNFGCHLWEKK
jgi:hypothetical protein